MMTIAEVRKMLRGLIDAAESKSAWARAHHVAPSYVSEVLYGRREPGPRMLKALGLRRQRVILYDVETAE